MKVYLLMYEYINGVNYDSIIQCAYLDKEKALDDCAIQNSMECNKFVTYYVTDVEIVE